MDYEIKIIRENNDVLLAKNTNIGDIMQVNEFEECYKDYFNHVLIHYFNGFVSLNDPSISWTHDCGLKVKLLTPRTKLILTIK